MKKYAAFIVFCFALAPVYAPVWTFVGAAIIVAATTYIAHREARAGGKKT